MLNFIANFTSFVCDEQGDILMITKGILNTISDGYANRGADTTRQFIEINNQRIAKTNTSNFIDSIMNYNIGNEIEISYRKTILFGNVIGSIKESNGQVSKINGGILFLYFFCRAAILFIPFAVLFICTLIVAENYLTVFLPIIAWLLYPTIQLAKDLKIKKALGK